MVLTRGMRRLNVGLSVGAIAFAAVVVIAVISRPTATLLGSWPRAGAAAVVAAGGPSGRVLADDAHSDWLLWEEPQLVGRLAYDVRFELFDQHQFARVVAFRSGTAPGVASGYRVLTFPNEAAARRLAAGRQITFRSTHFLVVR